MALLFLSLAAAGAATNPIPHQATSPEAITREAAIAEFTAKMKAANYPALFEQAAAEFGVPADILKGVAFTLTRWEHLTWPPGETRSPETGMPRPFGIMSLWDNEFFGHSLLDAAKLIGKEPEELKRDPLTNMRGAAALLKQIYAAQPKPAGTSTNDLESWRYALAEYVGIPERDLKHRFGLEVYEHLNKGYHQYGIEWNARPVNLAPMREEVKRIVAEETRKREEQMKAAGLRDDPPNRTTEPAKVGVTLPTPVKPDTDAAPAPVATAPDTAVGQGGFVWLFGIMVALVIGTLLALRRRQSS